MTERDVLTLVPGSLLNRCFNGSIEPKKINDEVFIDRDGRAFLNMVNYLRNRMTVLPDFEDRNEEINFEEELSHWGIPYRNAGRARGPSGGM